MTNRDEIPAPQSSNLTGQTEEAGTHPGARGQAESKAPEGQSGGWHPGGLRKLG